MSTLQPSSALTVTTAAWGEYSPHGLQRVYIALYKANRNSRARYWLRRFLEDAADVYDITWRNLRWRCHIRDNSTECHIVLGGKDNAPDLLLMEKQLRPGYVFVDLGANCGLFTLTAAQKVGENGRVIAVEPNPIMAERLRFNVSTNDFQNIHIVECAVGDVTGTAEFQVCVKQMGHSGFIDPVSGPRLTVPVYTLQDLLEKFDIDHVDAMKVDIEGFEDRAIMPLLKSAPKSLWPRVILIEILHAHLWRDGCVAALQKEGYEVEWQSRNDILLRFGERISADA